MKNKVLMAVVFVFAILVGGAFLVGNAPQAQACDEYYGDCGDWGGDYGCDYGCGDYSYDYDECDYGCYDYCDYGCDDYSDYGYDDYCDYGCGYDDYDYYDYDECDYGYCDDYDDCYDCDDYDYDECEYGCDTYTQPAQPINVSNENVNANYSVNNNNNNNVNNIVIRNNIGGSNYAEPVREREREVAVREVERALICTPASQSAPINQSVSLSVSGGNGNYSWNAPGSQDINGRGSSVQLRYPTSGLKTITVSSGGQSATCFVQVTGGQVLAEFIELPNTGAGGISAVMPNMLAIGGAVLGAIGALVFFVRRAIIA
jgi:hypothetical protein